MERRRTVRTAIQKLRSQNRELRKKTEALTASAERQETRATKAIKRLKNLKHYREQCEKRWENQERSLKNEIENLRAKIKKLEEIEILGRDRQIADLRQQIARSQPVGWSLKTPMNVIQERQNLLSSRGVQGGLGGL